MRSQLEAEKQKRIGVGNIGGGGGGRVKRGFDVDFPDGLVLSVLRGNLEVALGGEVPNGLVLWVKNSETRMGGNLTYVCFWPEEGKAFLLFRGLLLERKSWGGGAGLAHNGVRLPKTRIRLGTLEGI